MSKIKVFYSLGKIRFIFWVESGSETGKRFLIVPIGQRWYPYFTFLSETFLRGIYNAKYYGGGLDHVGGGGKWPLEKQCKMKVQWKWMKKRGKKPQFDYVYKKKEYQRLKGGEWFIEIHNLYPRQFWEWYITIDRVIVLIA